MSNARLQLVWPNKDRKLLTHGADTYEWVDPHDWRATEVRLLEQTQDVGDVSDGNLVIHGDALHALTSLTQLPELRARYIGQVKLCYIDPPFNTGQAFAHYNDAVEHSVWLTMMRDRLLQIRQLLSTDGSVWVHLDDAEMHRMRSVMDEVFGSDNFIATVIWEKKDSPVNSAKHLSIDHDFVLVYAKSKARWDARRLPRSAAFDAIYTNPDGDSRGRWYPGDPFANKPYSLGLYTVTGPTGRQFSPPPGRYWRISEEKFRTFEKEDRIWWGPDGNARPSIKRFLSEVSGLVPRTLWRHADVGSNRTSKNEMRKLYPGAASFATPKPEKFIQRILQIATDPGDLVLDCFAGSGTTAAVALKMGRRFVTVEVLNDTLAAFTLPRLSQVVEGSDDGGISLSKLSLPVADLPENVEVGDIKAAVATLTALREHGTFGPEVNLEALSAAEKALTAAARQKTIENPNGWGGGSGFRVLRVAPSMFVTDEDGDLYLADWVQDKTLAQAVCAQMRYTYDPAGPFAGRKGKSRIAVLDAMATEGAIRLLVDALEPGETVLVVAQAIGDGVEALLHELRKGSKARKIPTDLARAGVLPSQVVTLPGTGEGGDA